MVLTNPHSEPEQSHKYIDFTIWIVRYRVHYFEIIVVEMFDTVLFHCYEPVEVHKSSSC